MSNKHEEQKAFYKIKKNKLSFTIHNKVGDELDLSKPDWYEDAYSVIFYFGDDYKKAIKYRVIDKDNLGILMLE